MAAAGSRGRGRRMPKRDAVGAASGRPRSIGGGISKVRRLLLWAAATDATFVLTADGDDSALVGRCLHCGRRIAIRLNGEPLSDAGLEHIVPRVHGGKNCLSNIGVACTRCNNTKGTRHDHRGPGDAAYNRVVATLRARRSERAREPLALLLDRLDPTVLDSEE